MAESVEKVVELNIELSEIEPLVWRRIAVPADFPLRRLHDVIQAVIRQAEALSAPWAA